MWKERTAQQTRTLVSVRTCVCAGANESLRYGGKVTLSFILDVGLAALSVRARA